MEVRIQKWGNSAGIRIPSVVLKTLDLEINDILGLNLDENEKSIIISRSNNGQISLKSRFEKYNGENLAKEFEWDDSIGDETW